MINTSIIKKFDPTKEEHVRWLKKIDDIMNSSNEKEIIPHFMNNPMNAKFNDTAQLLTDWSFWHGCISIKYLQGIFNQKAWVPGYECKR
jgi:hypothetical protein